jgi:hypothetical protein
VTWALYVPTSTFCSLFRISHSDCKTKNAPQLYEQDLLTLDFSMTLVDREKAEFAELGGRIGLPRKPQTITGASNGEGSAALEPRSEEA